ncbi:MAG: hypothetical protein KAV00_12295 [Phycisphaerae bacterium]|nr:hypothetical protein [Phycisphaerae bacterium]
MLRTVSCVLVFVVAVCILAVNNWGCIHSGKTDVEGQGPEKVKQYTWKTIGTFTCHGVLDAHPDPRNPDKYIITWQRALYLYSKEGKRRSATTVRFSIYDAKAKTFSQAKCAFAFDFDKMGASQAHPCWGSSHGKYRVFYNRRGKKGSFLAEASADKWSDFQKYAIPKNERIATTSLGGPMSAFLAVDDSTAWLFYEIGPSNYERATPKEKEENGLAYSILHKDKGWDRIGHEVPTRTLAGRGTHIMGTPMTEGDDIVIYSSVGAGEKVGNAYRFRTSDRGKTWKAERLTVSGIDKPFKRDIDTQLFTTVIRKGKYYYMCSQSHTSHRWLARGTDGVHFKLVADFGQRRSLSNTMVNIKGTRNILLVYADYPHMATSRTCYPGIKKNIEYIIYDTGESD